MWLCYLRRKLRRETKTLWSTSSINCRNITRGMPELRQICVRPNWRSGIGLAPFVKEGEAWGQKVTTAATITSL